MTPDGEVCRVCRRVSAPKSDTGAVCGVGGPPLRGADTDTHAVHPAPPRQPDTDTDTRLPPDLELAIPGRPRTWKRTSGKTRHTPRDMRVAKQRVAIVLRRVVPEDWPLDGRYRLEVENHYAGGAGELEDGEPHTGAQSEADWDNLGKLISDAAEGYLWDDDRQVVDGRSLKRYAMPVEQVVVRVWLVQRAGGPNHTCPQRDVVAMVQAQLDAVRAQAEYWASARAQPGKKLGDVLIVARSAGRVILRILDGK